jgi:hypothetical protein
MTVEIYSIRNKRADTFQIGIYIHKADMHVKFSLVVESVEST